VTVIAVPVLLLLFVGIAARAAWRWLIRSVWGNVIVQVERKALRER